VRLLRIGLVTCAAVPELSPDDRLLAEALWERGVETRAQRWDDIRVDWTGFDAVVIRSAWDYHLRLREFLDWIDAMQVRGVRLWNPPDTVRANVHKSYLHRLAGEGVPVLPTRILERGSAFDLATLLAEEGWDEAVLKPAVSASAHRTMRVSRSSLVPVVGSSPVDFADGDLLVQAYAPEVVEAGEWSFVFLGGEFSHAVLKRPAEGDYRVQEEWGGHAVDVPPPSDLVDQAKRIAARIPRPWLYARIDGVDRRGTLLLMELELIEPYLYLGRDPRAPARLAAAVMAAAGSAGRWPLSAT
jgi:hypothetical protein